jgi:single-stranded-DNA-specific exonuclease
MIQRIWNISKPNLELQKQLSHDLGISKILTQLLIARGITDTSSANEFLRPDLSRLLSPVDLPDLAVACQRIKKAIRNKEKVMVFGDYDVDGLTSTALLKSVLERQGVSEVIHYLPHRINEGYGISRQAIKIAKAGDVKLLIAVDCGTSNFEEVEELRKMNIDVIIIDHHQPTKEALPSASSIINPKRKDSNYKYKDLAAVGLVYKFAQELTGDLLEEELDLVCLGTIADVVPLKGENRIIAKNGLALFARTKKPGLLALIEQSGVKNGCISTHTISYIIAPRINASGRIDSAETSLKLLLTKSEPEAQRLAKLLSNFNSQRQRIENGVLQEVQDMIEKEINFKDHKVIVVAKEGWHEGVLGIVASKIKDAFHRPAIIISIGDDLCKGSARSINNFHILDALSECKDILVRFGGHRRAAGMSITKENIMHLKERLNCIAAQKLVLEDFYPCLNIDMQMLLADLNEGLLGEIELLEPFGEGNAQPIFLTRDLRLKSRPEVLNSGTLICWVTDGQFTYRAVGFNMAEFKSRLENCRSFDLAYTLLRNKWQDFPSLQLKIEDIRIVNAAPL